jgi:hypothetical protein
VRKKADWERASCKFEECDRLAKARGWCQAHYAQWRRGETVRTLRPRGVHVVEKECTGCKVIKPRSEFYERKNGGLQGRCKKCMIKSARARYLRRKANADAA